MKKPLTFREFEPALWTLCDSKVQPLSHPGPRKHVIQTLFCYFLASPRQLVAPINPDLESWKLHLQCFQVPATILRLELCCGFQLPNIVIEKQFEHISGR